MVGKSRRKREELESLPGVGAYTAGAIASIAFGQDEAALDGNIRRVLARVFNMELPARSPEGERRLWALAREHLPPGRAGDYNQAWMDLGASVLHSQKPGLPDLPTGVSLPGARAGRAGTAARAAGQSLPCRTTPSPRR